MGHLSPDGTRASRHRETHPIMVAERVKWDPQKHRRQWDPQMHRPTCSHHIHTTSSSVLNMPPPYLSSKDIDGLMKTIPLYVYFPKSEWKNIRKGEEDSEEGRKILNHYSKIYKDNFLKKNQDDEKIIYADDKKQPLRSKIPDIKYTEIQKNKKLSPSELAILTMNN